MALGSAVTAMTGADLAVGCRGLDERFTRARPARHPAEFEELLAASSGRPDTLQARIRSAARPDLAPWSGTRHAHGEGREHPAPAQYAADR